MNQQISLKFDIPLEEIKVLKTGSIECIYAHGKIRYIGHRGRELVRMIYTAIRDENWNTAPYTISDERIEESDKDFHVRYTAHYSMNDIEYVAQVTIVGEDERLSYAMNGEALSDFKRNRIGICVLHNIPSISGRDVEVTTPAGHIYSHKFPSIISPHQPVKDIRRMRWQADGIQTTIMFEGDIFETEDQRNWTDSSFKTYSTPLDLPLPVQIKKGDKMSQQVIVVFDFSGEAPGPVVQGNSTRTTDAFPLIGYSKRPGVKLAAGEIALLREIIFDHYRVELDLTSRIWKEELMNAVDETRRIGARLQLTCFFGEDFETELTHFFEALIDIDHLVYSILIIDKKSSRSMPESYPVIYERITRQYPSIKAGYGTNNHFADLNRNLPGDLEFDFVSFGVTPQAHSTDTISLLENLDNQRDNIETIKALLGDVEIHISPLTFKGRKATLYSESDAPADFDERQHTGFGAAWILKALQNYAGLNVTLFDAVSYKGIVSDSHLKHSQPSPLFDLFKLLRSHRPDKFVEDVKSGDRIVMENSNGDRVEVLLDGKFNRTTVNSYFEYNQK